MNYLLVSFLNKFKLKFVFALLLFFCLGIASTAYSQAFRTTWITTDGTITIPTNGTGYNYTVSWTNLTNAGVNEGSATAQTGNYTLTGLENNSTYEIAISGDFPHFYMNVGSERLKLRTIKQWGTISWTSMQGAFFGCRNLTYTATDIPNLSGVTSMESMFRDCDIFDGNATMNNWDTQTITNFDYMFHNAILFNQPIGNWNTQNVTTMRGVFLGAYYFNQPLANWNTHNVTNMVAMLRSTYFFNQDISSWDTQNVTDMSAMFFNSKKFNQNISSWDTQNVTNMYGMFFNASNFNQNLGNWDISNVIVFLSNGMGTMLDNTALSTSNYDATLIGWAAQTVNPNINLGATGLTYCTAQAARNTLTSAPNNWIITGDSFVCASFPEINLQGNGNDITNNDSTPNTTDNTDFGNVAIDRTVTYTIENTGTADLIVSSIDVTGINASEFVLTPLTFPLTIVAGNTANFDIIFTPTGSGTKTATITVNNTDSDEGAYNFAIKGTSPTSVPNDFFVKTTGGNDTNGGTSFTDAYATLEKALSIANFGDKIYVAKGIYKPTRQVDVNTVVGADIRKVTFQIPDGIEVYGGFVGNEIAITQAVLDARNFITNTTTLSGDLSENDAVTGTFPNLVYENYTDNAYHIVYTKNVSSATKVDGFTIKGGNGLSGAGWYNDGSSLGNSSNPTLKNIIFYQNNTIAVGGAMYNHGYQGVSSPHLTNCFFFQNRSSVGGAMHNNGSFIGSVSIPTLTNCSFSQNYASHSGSAIYNDGYSDGTSGVNLTNCSFSQNQGGYRKGAIYFAATEGNTFAQIINTTFDKNDVHIEYDGVDANQDIKFINCTFTGATQAAIEIDRWSSSNIPINFSNCIFWNNTAMKIGAGGTSALAVTYSIIENNAYTGIGNINQNPLFVNTATGDLRLQAGSPALDMGSNAAINSTGVTIDLAGNARIQGTNVDMGAYEKAINLPEINLQGNGNDITNNDSTPNTNDNTDFGNVAIDRTVTYTIQNTGTGDLIISSIVISGANASEFVISNFTNNTSISAGMTNTFDITFTSSTIGLKIATITINNTDSDESVYDFAIQATKINVTPPPPPTPIEANLRLIATAVSSTQINLKWTINTQASSYLLYRDEVFVERISATTDTYNDENLTPDTFYQYKLIAVINATNSLPSWDNEWTFPEKPTLLSLSSVCGNGGKAIVKLTATGSIFRVYNDSTNGTLLLESINGSFELPFTNQDTVFYVSVIGIGRKESERLTVNVEIQTPFESVILGEDGLRANTQSSCTNSLLLKAQTIENADFYTWFLNGIQINTGIELMTTSSGIYQLRTTKGNCSYMSDTVIVRLNQSPVAQIQENKANQSIRFCENGMLNTVQTPQNTSLNAAYQWKLNNVVIGQTPNLEVSESGIYSLFVSTQNCMDSTSIEVNIAQTLQIPILKATQDSICRDNETTIFVENAENGVTYQWFRNGRLLLELSPSITTNVKGYYQVFAFQGRNVLCGSNSNEIEISHFDNFVAYLRENKENNSLFVEAANLESQITNVEWYFEGELKIELGNSFEISPTEKGNYSAKVTNQNGCIFQTRTVYFTPKITVTGEEDIKTDAFKIYPNPSTGIFKVAFETVLLENTEITIFDGIGRKIHTQTFEKGNQEFVIDVKNQPKGMYLIHFNQNNKTYTKQIIVE